MLMVKTRSVEIITKAAIAYTLDFRNSALLIPSMRFCFKVLYEYSLPIIAIITMAKNIFKSAMIKVLKCQIYGKLKIPCSAKLNFMGPNSTFIVLRNAIPKIKIKYTKVKTLDVLLYQIL